MVKRSAVGRLAGWGPINWLLAEPWRWHYRTIYRTLRADQRHPVSGRLLVPAHGRLRSAWLALTFPHVHLDGDDS